MKPSVRENSFNNGVLHKNISNSVTSSIYATLEAIKGSPLKNLHQNRGEQPDGTPIQNDKNSSQSVVTDSSVTLKKVSNRFEETVTEEVENISGLHYVSFPELFDFATVILSVSNPPIIVHYFSHENGTPFLIMGNGEISFLFDLSKDIGDLAELSKLINRKRIVGHDLKETLKSLSKHLGSLSLSKIPFDTLIAGQLLYFAKHSISPKDAEFAPSHLAEIYIGSPDPHPASPGIPQSIVRTHFDVVQMINQLRPLLEKELEKIFPSGQVPLFEFRFIPALANIELAGIPFNRPLLEVLYQTHHRIAQEEYKTLSHLGFNPQSDSQVIKFLNEQGLKVSGTSKCDLKPYADHPAVKKIFELRHSKSLSDFLRPFISTSEASILPKFTQISSPTGRMSSHAPNIHGIPREIKKQFYKPLQGRVIIKADFPAIEMRIAAVIANDPVLIECFRNNGDPHKITASKITGKPVEQIDPADRARAKAVNFGFLFGMGAETFQGYAADNFGIEISIHEARTFKDSFFATFPGIKSWHDQTAELLTQSTQTVLMKDGRVEKVILVHSILGRAVKAEGFCKALSYQAQASGSDLLKASVVIFERFKNESLDAKIINLTHDEIVIDCNLECQEVCSQSLKGAMERAADGILEKFPTQVEVEVILPEE